MSTFLPFPIPPTGPAQNRPLKVDLEFLCTVIDGLASLYAPIDATFVTLSTNSSLTNERVLTGTSNQIVVTDNGAGSTVVLSTPQNIHTAATPTFASETLTATTNQLTLGTTRTVTITAPTPASSSRTWTIPDLATSPTFAALEGSQTFTGGKTFNTGIAISDGTAGTLTGAIYFSSDTDTGIYHEANDSVSFFTAGAFASRLNGTGQWIGTAGTAAAPTYSFLGDGGAGLFLPVADTLGLAAGTTHTATIRQTTTSDAVCRTPLELFCGGGSVETKFRGQTTTSVSTSATKILDMEEYAVLVLVSGNDATNYFVDLLLTGYSGTPTVITSKTVAGSPTARTYSTVSNTDLKLLMASGTYSISVMSLQLKAR